MLMCISEHIYGNGRSAKRFTIESLQEAEATRCRTSEGPYKRSHLKIHVFAMFPFLLERRLLKVTYHVPHFTTYGLTMLFFLVREKPVNFQIKDLTLDHIDLQ